MATKSKKTEVEFGQPFVEAAIRTVADMMAAEAVAGISAIEVGDIVKNSNVSWKNYKFTVTALKDNGRAEMFYTLKDGSVRNVGAKIEDLFVVARPGTESDFTDAAREMLKAALAG